MLVAGVPEAFCAWKSGGRVKAHTVKRKTQTNKREANDEVFGALPGKSFCPARKQFFIRPQQVPSEWYVATRLIGRNVSSVRSPLDSLLLSNWVPASFGVALGVPVFAPGRMRRYTSIRPGIFFTGSPLLNERAGKHPVLTCASPVKPCFRSQ